MKDYFHSLTITLMNTENFFEILISIVLVIKS